MAKTDWEKRIAERFSCGSELCEEHAATRKIILYFLHEFAEGAAGINLRKAKELRAIKFKATECEFANTASNLEEAAREILSLLPPKKEGQ